MADVASGEVETALHREMSLVFDLLGDDFAEDELFGEILGADYDAIRARRAAGGEKEQRNQQRQASISSNSGQRICDQSRKCVSCVSFAPLGLAGLVSTHGLRRGLYSCAAARLLCHHASARRHLARSQALLQPSQAGVRQHGQGGGGNCAGQYDLIIDHGQIHEKYIRPGRRRRWRRRWWRRQWTARRQRACRR